MTVSTTNNRIAYTGDGTTTVFAFPYKFITTGDIVVYLAGVLQSSGYTVGTPSDTGANVTFNSAPALSAAVVLISSPAKTQSTALPSTGPFPAKAVETALDKLTMLVQRLGDLIGRSLTLSDGDSTSASTMLPTPTASNLLGWNSAGSALINLPVASLGTTIVANTWIVDKFNGTGAQTSFILSNNPGATNAVLCSVSGVTQVPGVNFSVSGTTLTFLTGAPASGTGNVVAQYGQAVSTLSNPDASAITYTPSGAGAIQTTVQQQFRNLQLWMINIKDAPFYVKGDGITDDTAGFQAALNYCYSVNKDFIFPSGNFLISGQLINKGVSMIGEGRFYSQILLATTFPAGVAPILIQPDSGAYIDFLELGRFSVQPTNGGTKYGGSCIFMNFQQPTNLSKLHMHDLYLLPGNDFSLQIANNMAVNYQGVPANSTIERCYFAEGTKLVGIGDSNMIHENIYRATGGNRCAIHLYMSDTSGVASHTVIRENNIDCPGGALYAVKGRSIKFIYNNVELSAGPGTTNGAVVDIDGSSGSIPWSEVESNHIGIFGTATATSAVRVNGAQGCSVDKNTILSGITVASGISITISAGDTDVGFNEIQSNYTTPINNSGLRTMGVPLALSFVNGFSNTGGGYQALTAYKNRNGLVTIDGVVNAPATPSGLTIATLSAGYRPLTLQRFAVSTVSGGAIVAYAIEVDTSGNVVCYCASNTTRIEINATFPTLNYVSGSL